MTLLRGYADDMVLQTWLEKQIWPVEAKLNKTAVEIGTRLGLLEMIQSGTSSFLDMYFFEDAVGKMSEEMTVRAFLGFALIDFGTPEYSSEQLFPECQRFIAQWKNNKLITPVIAPHAAYTCSPETLQAAHEMAEKQNVLLHIHCSETRDEVYDVKQQYGERPVGHLKKLGVLDKNMILAHCGWITKNEIVDLQKQDVKVVHCPVSNMKIATGGYAPVPEMLNAGLAVGLGTDGAASNNTLDMFDTMKFCALVHKQHRWDPEVLPAQTVLDMATVHSARCLGMENKLGSIEEGKIADIIMVDMRKPRLTPHHNYVSHLVYACRGDDVSSTIINGRPVMLNREILDVNVEQVMTQAETCAHELIN